MDELIVWIVFALVYFLFQALGAKKKKSAKRPVPSQPQPNTPSPEVTLDDALREIRQALGMEMPHEPEPKPVPEPVPPLPSQEIAEKKHPYLSRQHAPELGQVAAPPSWGSEFRPVESVYADVAFEAIPTDAEGFASLERIPPLDAPVKQSPPPSPTATPRARIVNTLRNQKAAQEAFILHEVLSPPRALRRH